LDEKIEIINEMCNSYKKEMQENEKIIVENAVNEIKKI